MVLERPSHKTADLQRWLWHCKLTATGRLRFVVFWITAFKRGMMVSHSRLLFCNSLMEAGVIPVAGKG
jgi:hypothetical protein